MVVVSAGYVGGTHGSRIVLDLDLSQHHPLL